MRFLSAALIALSVALTSSVSPAASAAEPAARGTPSKVASVEGVTEYRLANGLKVLLVPDASVDTVTVSATYLVGSRHEGYGEAGMAHLLEHLLFRGSARFPNIKGELTRRGARFNGTTSYDRTNYYETLPAGTQNLDWAIALEADRMVRANVSRKDLDAEMTVVRNEFESGENSPFAVLRERVAATAWLWHNYGRAVIGARSDIENVPIDRLRAFYRHYYQPDNAMLVIAGRFDEAAALRMVARRFAGIAKPARALRKTYTVEPVQDGERSVTLRRVGDVQLVSALYHVAPGTHADYAAIDVLVSLLGHVPGGRLHRALVETGLASSSFGTDRQQREAGAISFGATIKRDQPIEAARDALLATLEGLERAPVTGEEVERARTRLLNAIEMTVADSGSLALLLSETYAMGDWRMLFLHRDRLRGVSTADVQRVATHYLKPSNRTLGMFVPTASPERAEIPAVPDAEAMLKGYRGAGPVAQGEAFDPTPANIESRVIRRTLPGGLRLALLPKKTRGATVVAQLSLRWGDERSKSGRATACGIASAMLMRGTRHHTREQLANEFARLKAQVGAGGEGASAETDRENLPAVLKLLAEVLREPAFPEAEFEQLRRSSLTSIDAARGQPGALAGIELSRHLNPYPGEHWHYTATLDERAARLNALKLEDVAKCYREFLGASDGELAVVGDFDAVEIARLADSLFGDWGSPRPYRRIEARVFDVAPIDRTIETPDKANATWRAALSFAMRDDHPDYVPLMLANYLLGGSADSRLSRRVREREGISYSVGSYFNASGFDPKADFGLYAIFAPQNRARIDAAIREELQRALTEGFGADEVEAGRKGLLKARQVGRSEDSALASRLAALDELGRTFAWDARIDRAIAAVTPLQITEAMRRHIDAAKLSIVRAGDFSGKKSN